MTRTQKAILAALVTVLLAACDRPPERQQRALILACSVQKQVTEGSEASDLLQACDPQSAGKEQTEDLPPDQLAL